MTLKIFHTKTFLETVVRKTKTAAVPVTVPAAAATIAPTKPTIPATMPASANTVTNSPSKWQRPPLQPRRSAAGTMAGIIAAKVVAKKTKRKVGFFTWICPCV